jgi:hypothetical protein
MAKATAESRDDAIQLIIETEFPSVLIEDVRYLLCKVQKGLSWEDAIDALITWGQPVEAEERSELAAACERLREVEKLTFRKPSEQTSLSWKQRRRQGCSSKIRSCFMLQRWPRTSSITGFMNIGTCTKPLACCWAKTRVV